MPKIPEYYQIGDRKNITPERLLVILEDMYTDLARAVNLKPDILERDIDGIGDEVFLSNGDININLTTDKVEMLTNHPTATTVTWTTLS